MNMMKKVYAEIMTLYGAAFTALAIIAGIIPSDGQADGRIEFVILMTCIPALIHGLRTLKRVWTSEAIREKDKELDEVRKSCQLTIVDKAG